MEMGQEENQSMVVNLLMRIYILSTTKEDNYLWLIQDQIQMDHNFL